MALSVGKHFFWEYARSCLKLAKLFLLERHNHGYLSWLNALRSSRLVEGLRRAPTCKILFLSISIAFIAYLFSGPLISTVAKKRVIELIGSAEEDGGNVVLDGRNLTVPEYPEGNFVGPTIIEAGTRMRCYQ